MSARVPQLCTAAILFLTALGCTQPPGGAGSNARGAQPSAALADTAQSSGSTNGPAAVHATACTARELVLRPDASNGDLNGMSHSGTYLRLTNRSRSACSIPGVPQLTFLDANGPVQTTADLSGAKFMHPGPQVVPLVLQPKQSISTSARWVSGPVFSDSFCYKLTGVTLLLLHDGGPMAPLSGQMCGDRSKGVHYDLQRYGALQK